MKAIVLTNSWLSGVQKGLQAGHALVEMSLYSEKDPSLPKSLYEEWARFHKTLIVLEGGSHRNLEDFFLFLHKGDEVDYTFSSFSEDEESLNCATTAVAVILSDKYEDYLQNYRQRDLAGIWLQLTDWEKEFFQRLNLCKLAS